MKPPRPPSRKRNPAFKPSGRPPRKPAPFTVAPARQAAFETLLSIETSEKMGDLSAVSPSWKGLHPRDAALARELVYGTTRMRRLIDHRLSSFCNKTLELQTPPVKTALRMAAYQLLFLDRVPAHAAVHESVTLVKRADVKLAGFANAVLRSLAEKRPFPPPEAPTEVEAAALAHSHPTWLVERWAARFDAQELQRLLSADNRPHDLFMRVRPGNRDTVLAALGREGYETKPLEWPEDSFLLTGRGGGLFGSESFLRGDWIVQDWSQQAMMELAPVTEGMRVWDVCAAPGGKSVGLAWKCGASGSVLAGDVSEARVKLLRDNLKRTGLANVRVHEGDLRKMPGSEKFHAVWLDAPCSGTGVLSRRADLRWRLRSEEIARHAAEQARLLDEVQRRVYPGGWLLYSTCSLEPEENEGVIGAFLKAHPLFEVQTVDVPGGPSDGRVEGPGILFFPTESHDGGYFALLRRTTG